MFLLFLPKLSQYLILQNIKSKQIQLGHRLCVLFDNLKSLVDLATNGARAYMNQIDF